MKPLGRIPMGRALSWQAARDPDAPALTMGDVTLTRGELDRAANRLARDLAARGLGVGDRAAVVLPTGPAHQIACFALWKLGVTVIALPVYAVDKELRHFIDLSDPRLVIGVDPDRLPNGIVIPAGHVPDPAIDDSPLPDAVAPVWKAIASGGSTGLPKLIFDASPSLIDPLRTSPMLQIQPGDVMLHPAPAHHNSPFAQTAFALCSGCHVVLMPRFDAEAWLRLVERHRVSWAYLVPTMMSRILALPLDLRERADVSSLRRVYHMAAPCPEWVKAAWIDWLGADRIWEIYGGTEGFGGTLIGGEEWLAHRGSVGRPGQPVDIRDEDGRALPAGEIGTIWFGRHPAMPAAPGEEAWRSFGDMGWLDTDGYLYIADRRADLILTGGVNIYPAEIEGTLLEHPAIAQAIVIGMPHADLGARAHALIELMPGEAPPEPEALLAFLRERLSPTKLPYTFEIVPGPLRDDAGKARRSQLRDERIASPAMQAGFRRLR